jgi:stress-induced morphogen
MDIGSERVYLPYSLTTARNLTVKWEFYVQMISRAFEGASGIGKHFLVNDSKVFSSEMHPRSGIQVVYAI